MGVKVYQVTTFFWLWPSGCLREIQRHDKGAKVPSLFIPTSNTERCASVLFCQEWSWVLYLPWWLWLHSWCRHTLALVFYSAQHFSDMGMQELTVVLLSIRDYSPTDWNLGACPCGDCGTIKITSRKIMNQDTFLKGLEEFFCHFRR